MGVAIIPIIYSIADDAISGVPKQLALGSLALGATSWQTLRKVVLPTASAGIFSAVMMGLSRAVGETMIIFIAIGSTPMIDVQVLERIYLFVSNAATGLDSGTVNTSYYVVLVFAGSALFVFTLIINALAEVIRYRLRKYYRAL